MHDLPHDKIDFFNPSFCLKCTTPLTEKQTIPYTTIILPVSLVPHITYSIRITQTVTDTYIQSHDPNIMNLIISHYGCK